MEDKRNKGYTPPQDTPPINSQTVNLIHKLQHKSAKISQNHTKITRYNTKNWNK